MASARKRSLHEMDGAAAEPPKEPSMLERLRNMWQFANLCQWLLIFGGAVKADSYEIEVCSTLTVSRLRDRRR